MKLLVAVLVLTISAVTVIVANEAFGVSTPVGEPYTAENTYCSIWNPATKNTTCLVYQSKTETRVNTIVKGLFFNTTSYKVISE